MAWSALAMMVSALALIVLHLRRRSRRTWLALLAGALAALTFLSGFSIGVYVAPVAIVALVVAAVAVPASRAGA